ncbi:MAG: VOC family protein [Bacteroidota bacterium]
MNPIYKTYHPEGFHSVNSYLMTEDPPTLIEFLKNVFHAEEKNRTMHPKDGTIANCILQIGDSSLMVAQAKGPFMGMRTAFYLYVNDVDGLHERAVAHGAKVEFPPADMPYGDRQSGVMDPAGNYWWISQRLEEKNYD